MKSLIFLMVFFIAGCMTSEEISGLLTLKKVSSSQAQAEKQIQADESRFQKILSFVQENKLKMGRSKKWVIAAFGEPNLVNEIQDDPIKIEYFMYRHPDKFFGSERVYLFFDKNSSLVDYKYEESY